MSGILCVCSVRVVAKQFRSLERFICLVSVIVAVGLFSIVCG